MRAASIAASIVLRVALVCGCRACLLPVGNVCGCTAAVVCTWQIPALPWYGVSPGLMWCCMGDNAYLVGYRYLLLVIISAADGGGVHLYSPLAVFSRSMVIYLADMPASLAAEES